MIETVILSIERSGRSGGAGGLGEAAPAATTWAASGRHLFGAGSKSSWCRAGILGRRLPLASGDLPALGSKSPLILSIICLSDAMALWMRSLSIKNLWDW